MFNIRRILTVFALLASTSALADGPDKQTPEEIRAAREAVERDFRHVIFPTAMTRTQQRSILAKYPYLDPKKEVPTDLLETTVLFYDQNRASFPNPNYVTILDFNQRSNKPRFFVINMITGEVEKHWTIHGWGSDRDKDGYAESFGNVINSGKSSLGFIRTAEIYSGTFKRAVRLDGLSDTNSNVRERAIVLHGWDDAHEKPVIQGLGWGCPALDWSVKDDVIDKVALGSLMYIGVSQVSKR